MSYILEALRKAEQQRELGRVPGIASDHDTGIARSSGHWLWLAVLLPGISVVVLLLMLWPGRGQYDRNLVAAPPASVEPQQVPVPQLASRATGDPAPGFDRLESRSTPSPAPISPIAEPEDNETAPVMQRSKARADVRPHQSGRVVSQVSTAFVGEPVIQEQLPVWPQIPQAVFEQLSGGLRLDVHVYSDQVSDRFVLINLQKYNEGDKLQNGPVLDEITPQGAVLSFQGQKFRLQAQ